MPTWTPEQLSEYNRRVAGRKSVASTVVSASEMVKETRVRQSHKQPSKIHRDWGNRLREMPLIDWIHEEAITLKLCNGVRYSPDWVTFHVGGRITAWEVKGGFFRDDARKSLLFAAKEYQWIRFVLVWREKGEWRQQEIVT